MTYISFHSTIINSDYHNISRRQGYSGTNLRAALYLCNARHRGGHCPESHPVAILGKYYQPRVNGNKFCATVAKARVANGLDNLQRTSGTRVFFFGERFIQMTMMLFIMDPRVYLLYFAVKKSKEQGISAYIKEYRKICGPLAIKSLTCTVT